MGTSLMASPRPAAAKKDVAQSDWPVRVADLLLWIAFLGLSFSLGAFPLRDTDFWWHLRTGDLIRQNGVVPQTDWYTYTVPDNRWIDLHWGFQVLLSWGYAHGGVVTLTLAKCFITTCAVFLLISARRKEWPFWIMALVWLPALFVLGGRMYVRPETLSLLYISAFLAVIFRWDRFPWLAFALPVVEGFWVNTQGLFVLGPVILGCGLVDAALRPGAFSRERKRWWRSVGTATVLTGAACLVNPYGLRGAIFPLQLAETMRNPLFQSIGELTPLPVFITMHGWSSVPLQLHIWTMVLGAFSFLAPLLWSLSVRPAKAEEMPAAKKRKKKKNTPEPAPRAWRLSPFRILLYVAFSVLGLQASRNSHQFAAIVGAITAWNFGEWVGAMRARKIERGESCSLSVTVGRRAAVLLSVALAIVAVLSGSYYALAGEGRTVGLDEERLWFAHDAVKFAAQPDMPARALVFHNGLAALYDYHAGPERKVFADARLEVIGPDLYARYMDLNQRIAGDRAGWEQEISEGGRPVVIIDNLQVDTPGLSAVFFTKSEWKCVWFDPMATIFLHESDLARARALPIDFWERHFRGELRGPKVPDELLTSARALKRISEFLRSPSPERAAPLITLGLEQAKRLLRLRPDLGEAWKIAGQLEMLRSPPRSSSQISRYQLPFDPIYDIPIVRATYDLLQSVERGAYDFTAIVTLMSLYQGRGMNEAALPWAERLATMSAINPAQKKVLASLQSDLPALRRALPPIGEIHWENRNELERGVTSLLAAGRAESAADVLERAFPEARARTWELADQLATLRLHLGQPARARAIWSAVSAPPRPALQAARVAVTYLVEDNFDSAREQYRKAIDLEPKLFEALFGLALLEHDAGRATESVSAADRAAQNAPAALAEETAAALAKSARPYAKKASGGR
jgi:tetratricopeptide (TPR) repeat protein